MPALPFKLNQDRRRHIPEQKRKVTNWRDYDESLRRRGSLTVWFSDEAAWIIMRSATDLSKADLHVFSKLFDDGLERGQEAKAFSWRQIGGHDDILDFFVGHLINVDMTRQPAP